ncbi:sugar phosphate isomerase/epimerase family protein [Priestia koreensis]|uniref:sugar phosphate isomerase/epimerase family protein n=1 Tax=Priestia koreensis TaxID=284581 RepID=UPI0020402B0F|nr:TIM barrel protein [Priestia koreensis]MCM3005856.1 sugar phosphate isomerase/epimerase [Priestia koreensis]
MHITALSDEISDNFQKQLELLKKHNLCFIDLRDIENKNILEHTDKYLDYIKAELTKNKIQVSCISTQIGKQLLPNSKNETLEILRQVNRAISVAQKFKAKFIRIFSFYHDGSITSEKSIIRLLNEFNTLAIQENITLLIENEPKTYAYSIENIDNLFSKIQSDYFKLLWDTGNFSHKKSGFTKKEHLYFLNIIKYAHIKDIDVDTKEKKLPGNGSCEVEKFIEDLHFQNYQGYLCLEPLIIYNHKYAEMYRKEELFSLALCKLLNIVESVSKNL